MGKYLQKGCLVFATSVFWLSIAMAVLSGCDDDSVSPEQKETSELNLSSESSEDPLGVSNDSGDTKSGESKSGDSKSNGSSDEMSTGNSSGNTSSDATGDASEGASGNSSGDGNSTTSNGGNSAGSTSATSTTSSGTNAGTNSSSSVTSASSGVSGGSGGFGGSGTLYTTKRRRAHKRAGVATRHIAETGRTGIRERGCQPADGENRLRSAGSLSRT